MLPELHPFLLIEYAQWWPFVYFFMLFFVTVISVFYICLRIRNFYSTRPYRNAIRRIKDAKRIQDDKDFVNAIVIELFAISHFLSGSTFPDEEWLKAISSEEADFTSKPYRSLLDICLRSPQTNESLTVDERKLICKGAVMLIRKIRGNN